MPKYSAHVREVPKTHNCRHVLAFEHLLKKKREIDASFPLPDIRGINRNTYAVGV